MKNDKEILERIRTVSRAISEALKKDIPSGSPEYMKAVRENHLGRLHSWRCVELLCEGLDFNTAYDKSTTEIVMGMEDCGPESKSE